MPRIPTYDTPQVEARALPGARQSSIASPELFGAGAAREGATGKALLAAGTGMANAAARMQDRENADMLFRAESALKDDYLAYEDDVRNNRHGQKAWGVTKDTEKWFADQEKKHSGVLANDVQRQLFSQSVTKMRQSAVNSFSAFEAGERRKSLEESSRASIVGSINMASASAAEGLVSSPPTGTDAPPAPNPIAGIKRDIINRVQVLADLNGWAPERRQLEEATHLTNLHKQVIQNLADRNADKAREYFNANKSEINGSEYDGIDKVLKHGETKQAGFLFAERDDIRKLATDEDRRAAARDFFKDDPDKRDAALREINTRETERVQSREKSQRTAADTAWSIYGRSGNLNDVPASVLAEMDGKDYAAMKDHAAAKAAGKGTVTDFATYYDLRQQALADPAGFRKIDLRRYIGKLSPSDLEEMAKLQTAKPHEIKDAATLSQQLSNTHDLLKWGNSDKDKKGAFDRAVTDLVSEEQRKKGKELTYDERQALIDRMVIEGDTNGWLPFGSKRYYEVQGKSDAAKFEPKIPDADRQTIVDRFEKRAGRKPTDTEIMQTFRKWKGI